MPACQICKLYDSGANGGGGTGGNSEEGCCDYCPTRVNVCYIAHWPNSHCDVCDGNKAKAKAESEAKAKAKSEAKAKAKSEAKAKTEADAKTTES